MAAESKTAWTPGEWRAEVDSISSVEHTETMRTVLPHYKPPHQCWGISAWRDNTGVYVAETGCNEYSEANARLISKAPELVEALESACESLEQLVKLNRIPANNKGLREGRALLQQIRGESWPNN